MFKTIVAIYFFANFSHGNSSNVKQNHCYISKLSQLIEILGRLDLASSTWPSGRVSILQKLWVVTTKALVFWVFRWTSVRFKNETSDKISGLDISPHKKKLKNTNARLTHSLVKDKLSVGTAYKFRRISLASATNTHELNQLTRQHTP